SDTKESINFKELSLNSNQENNTKQSNTIIDDIKEDFKIVSNNAIINNTNFKGKKIA
ncbi:hypothetical protein IO413_001570, partial [Campylobacter lari]|nr:hypothetical protein [Campylobacter lari]